YMDWATQPDPFRRYDGSELISLPLMLETDTPAYRDIFEEGNVTPSELNLETLSQLLQFSLGLAAWKSIGNDSWALRCNASSGNLHPTEAYIAAPPVEGLSSTSTLTHYVSKEHGIEQLAEFDTTYWNDLPEGSFLVALSSVLWREAWKYGERAFRYCQLDAGHAQRAVEVSAAMLGWKVDRLNVAVKQLDRLIGIDQTDRYMNEERESADMLLLITPEPVNAPDITMLVNDLPEHYTGKANRLSPSHHPWEAIDLAEKATHIDGQAVPYSFTASQRTCDRDSKEVVLKRRSAQAMDFGLATISKTEFMTMMQSVKARNETAVNFVLFIHHVEELPKGLYMMVRNPGHLSSLKTSTREDFLWREYGDGLYLLEEGDFKPQAKFISCSQDIAADSAFSLGMLCEFKNQLESHGAHRYKELYWECGAIGQQLYLEATSLKLSATGIGCFLDDVLHRMLGLEANKFQTLYHFTIGRPIIDMRLTTLPPYAHLSEVTRQY
ncbi:MAG: nitroreductase family protein, partial [Sulfurimonadaceae bacterium]|nr:nitroreductase family protein [Sulfurimonadaceae bacterium]